MATSIKISQLPAKGSNLEATDLLEVSEFNGTGYVSKSITGAEIVASIPPTSVEWGDIGGTLSSQTDLNTALSGKVPTSRTLTINGTTQDLSADRTFTISTGITIGTTAITSGTVGRVLFEGTGNVVQESANMTFDNSTGAFQLTTTADNVVGLRLKSTTGQVKFRPYLNSTYGVLIESKNAADSALLPMSLSSNKLLLLDGNVVINSTSDNGAKLQITSGGATSATTSLTITNTSATRLLQIWDDGNIGINTTTNAGFKLDVNGTARVQDNITASKNVFDTTRINVSNTTSSASSSSAFVAISSAGSLWMGKYSATSSTYKITVANDSYISNSTVGDLSIVNDVSTGKIKFGAGGSSTSQMTLFANGNVGINTTTDAGFKLDVNGTARVKGTGTTSATVAFTVENSAGSKSLIIKDDASVFLGDSITNGTGLDVLNQRPQRLYTYGNGQVGHYISSTVNAGTGDTSLGLFGLGTGGGYFGGVRVFTSSDSNTPILAMIVDRNQSVGIGLTNSTNLTVNASAKVQIDSTTKGFLPPRMTTTQKNAIASPATGLQIYDSTLNRPCFYDGTSWITL
jgi:hypothetical protein